jgi:hypothetical protein
LNIVCSPSGFTEKLLRFLKKRANFHLRGMDVEFVIVIMGQGFLLLLQSSLYQFPFPKFLTFVNVSSGSDKIDTLIQGVQLKSGPLTKP